MCLKRLSDEVERREVAHFLAWLFTRHRLQTAMSNLLPSSLQQPQTTPSYYTDCYSCRLTGTITFSAVGLYALTAARIQAKTQIGKGVASLAGLGKLSSFSRHQPEISAADEFP